MILIQWYTRILFVQCYTYTEMCLKECLKFLFLLIFLQTIFEALGKHVNPEAFATMMKKRKLHDHIIARRAAQRAVGQTNNVLKVRDYIYIYIGWWLNKRNYLHTFYTSRFREHQTVHYLRHLDRVQKTMKQSVYDMVPLNEE